VLISQLAEFSTSTMIPSQSVCSHLLSYCRLTVGPLYGGNFLSTSLSWSPSHWYCWWTGTQAVIYQSSCLYHNLATKASNYSIPTLWVRHHSPLLCVSVSQWHRCMVLKGQQSCVILVYGIVKCCCIRFGKDLEPITGQFPQRARLYMWKHASPLIITLILLISNSK
jgi:hypothetical protein